MYVWVPVPDGHTSVVVHASWCWSRPAWSSRPGSSYGPNGEGYVRISLTLPDDRLREAMERIEQHLRVAA